MADLLTEAEIQALPEEIQPHYRKHNFLRDNDDLVYFPQVKREYLEHLIARGSNKTVERIRGQEGTAAAEEAADQVAEEQASRIRRADELSRAS